MKFLGLFSGAVVLIIFIYQFDLGSRLFEFNSDHQTQSQTEISAINRKPASTEELFLGVERVLSDIKNDSVLNAQNCPVYIRSITHYLYDLKADFFIPKNPQELELLKTKGLDLMKNIFQIRVALRERFQEFDEKGVLTPECTLKVREGLQYSRISEEYILDWLVNNKVVNQTKPIILEHDPVFTLENHRFENFSLETGDLMVIRGKSSVSAMIARIGDEEGNFSHLAIVTENDKGQKFVVEALIQSGVIITALDKWRQAQDARVVLYRQRDPDLGKKAGRLMYDFARAKLNKDGEIRYDFEMNELEHSAFFCAEVATYAYEKASEGKFLVPKFKSSLSKFVNTHFPASMGIKAKTLFAPYDIEVDPRFDFVAEYKFYPLLRQVRLQDAVFQSIYSWLIEKKYDFYINFPTSAKSYLGKFLRQFGFFEDMMPKYMPIQTMNTVAQFQSVAAALEKNLYAKEDEYYKKNGYLPTFSDFIAINEEFRKQDCLEHKGESNLNPADLVVNFKGLGRKSKFHWFFHAKDSGCN